MFDKMLERFFKQKSYKMKVVDEWVNMCESRPHEGGM